MSVTLVVSTVCTRRDGGTHLLGQACVVVLAPWRSSDELLTCYSRRPASENLVQSEETRVLEGGSRGSNFKNHPDSRREFK